MPSSHQSHQFVIFARTLPPQSAPLRVRICASQSYELFLNGQFVGRGPVTGSDEWRMFDEYLWTPDDETIEVTIVALHERPSPSAVWPVEAGVIASFVGDDGEIGTDENWRCWPLENWRETETKRGGALGFCEDYDAALAPDGWAEKIFAPDNNWQNAVTASAPKVDFAPRLTPYLKREFIAPKTFWAWRTRETGAADIGEISRFCDVEPLDPLAPPRAFDLDEINEMLAGGANAFTFDLGAEHVGFYALAVSAPRGTVLEISGAELLQTDQTRPAIFRKSTRYSARVTAGENLTDFVSWNWSGFRYLHLVVRGDARNVRLERVGCLERKLQLPPALSCDLNGDAQLKQIFELCQRTLEVGVQEHMIDCPTREQLQYWGDAVWVAQSLWRGWGEPSFLKFSSNVFCACRYAPTGKSAAFFPAKRPRFCSITR